MESGFIKLHRKILDWQWYCDTNVFVLFIHLLFKANYKDKKWLNLIIKRGQLVTSSLNLAEELNLSRQQIRTALDKLKSSQEIVIKSTNKYMLITVVKYNDYQDKNIEDNQQITNKQPTNNQQITTTKEYKEIKNIIINNNKYFENEELNKIFLEYLELRKKLKAINTERTINTLIKILDPYEDIVKIKMIEQSIVSSWKSIYPLKEEKQNNKKATNIIHGKMSEEESQKYYDNL